MGLVSWAVALPGSGGGQEPASPMPQTSMTAKGIDAQRLRLIVGQQSFSVLKYGNQLSNQQFFTGSAKAVNELRNGNDQIKSLELEVCAKLVSLPEQAEHEKLDPEFAKTLLGYLKTTEAEAAVSIAQFVIDDVPELSGTKDASAVQVVEQYKRRVKFASDLKCRNVVVYVDQVPDPNESKVIIEHLIAICKFANECSNNRLCVLIEPRRGRSAGIEVIREFVDQVRKSTGHRDGVGVCLNLSAIPDEDGELWTTTLLGYVRAVAIETYRFTKSGAVKESNRDYAAIMRRAEEEIQKRSKLKKGDPKKDSNRSVDSSPFFNGDVTIRYLGRDPIQEGLTWAPPTAR
jgi:hypothetical protein